MATEALDALREAAHTAPLNIVHTDHKGRKSLGSHSMAWAKDSRAYAAARDAAQ